MVLGTNLNRFLSRPAAFGGVQEISGMIPCISDRGMFQLGRLPQTRGLHELERGLYGVPNGTIPLCLLGTLRLQ